MFGIILISVITFLYLYVFARAATIPFVIKYLSLNGLLIIGVIAWLLFVVGREYGHRNLGTFAGITELIGMNLMGTIFLMAAIMLIADILTGFGFIFSTFAPHARGLALISGLLISIFANVQGVRQPVLTSYDVDITNLDESLEGTKIIALTDTHLGKLIGSGWFSKVVDKTMAQKPNMIVLVGDIIEGRQPLDEDVRLLFDDLKAPMGVWAVVGNHDDNYKADGTFPIQATSAKLLFDQNIEIAPKLIVAGVRDLSFGQINFDYVGKTLKDHADGTIIYLSHAPVKYEDAAKSGVDLMISGHTHSGQIWPFSYLVRTHYPLYRDKYDVNGMSLIVSRGAGTWGPRMRLWERGEIVEITLHKKQK